jgi:acyl carrier protein
MTPDLAIAAQLKQDIRAKVVEIAARDGADATRLNDDDLIPQTGMLDSAGIMELIVWYETWFDLAIDPAELTIANFGSIDAMAAYAQRHGRRD